MVYDIVVVGAGIAGLTSSAFLSKSGFSVLICEKEDKVGGLINSFNRGGFVNNPAAGEASKESLPLSLGGGDFGAASTAASLPTDFFSVAASQTPHPS